MPPETHASVGASPILAANQESAAKMTWLTVLLQSPLLRKKTINIQDLLIPSDIQFK
jgi:hypothetical protein